MGVEIESKTVRTAGGKKDDAFSKSETCVATRPVLRFVHKQQDKRHKQCVRTEVERDDKSRKRYWRRKAEGVRLTKHNRAEKPFKCDRSSHDRSH